VTVDARADDVEVNVRRRGRAIDDCDTGVVMLVRCLTHRSVLLTLRRLKALEKRHARWHRSFAPRSCIVDKRVLDAT